MTEGLYYALSGFYRYDNGPVDSGFPTEGYQVRGNLKKVFETGEVKVYFQGIDDRDQFYGDIPLTGTGYHLARGNNGNVVNTTETSALDNSSFADAQWAVCFQGRSGGGHARLLLRHGFQERPGRWLGIQWPRQHRGLPSHFRVVLGR